MFTGWTPEVTETVTQTVTYSAQWAVDENGNDKPDNDEKYTVSYQFINGADDKELPKEVNDMLPKHRHLLELEKTTIEERIDTAVSKETDGIF